MSADTIRSFPHATSGRHEAGQKTERLQAQMGRRQGEKEERKGEEEEEKFGASFWRESSALRP